MWFYVNMSHISEYRRFSSGDFFFRSVFFRRHSKARQIRLKLVLVGSLPTDSYYCSASPLNMTPSRGYRFLLFCWAAMPCRPTAESRSIFSPKKKRKKKKKKKNEEKTACFNIFKWINVYRVFQKNAVWIEHWTFYWCPSLP